MPNNNSYFAVSKEKNPFRVCNAITGIVHAHAGEIVVWNEHLLNESNSVAIPENKAIFFCKQEGPLTTNEIQKQIEAKKLPGEECWCVWEAYEEYTGKAIGPTRRGKTAYDIWVKNNTKQLKS